MVLEDCVGFLCWRFCTLLQRFVSVASQFPVNHAQPRGGSIGDAEVAVNGKIRC